MITSSRLQLDLIMFSSACSITDYDTDTVILTGGYGDDYYSSSTVERYGHYGLEETLPSLNTARNGHGCGCYYNDYGQKVEFGDLFFLTKLCRSYSRDQRL